MFVYYTGMFTRGRYTVRMLSLGFLALYVAVSSAYSGVTKGTFELIHGGIKSQEHVKYLKDSFVEVFQTTEDVSGYFSMKYYDEALKHYSPLSLYFLNPTCAIFDLFSIFICFMIFMLTRHYVFGPSNDSKSPPSVLLKFVVKHKITKPYKEQKFCDASCYLLWHFCAFLWGTYILIHEYGTADNFGWLRYHIENPDHGWFFLATATDVSTGSLGWPLLFMTSRVYYYYIVQLAFWLHCGVYIFYEYKRNDFVQLLSHHIGTCILILFSYISSYWRIGLLVLYLHDIVDVFLYLAKCCHYVFNSKIYETVAFVGLLISYAYCRLYSFPMYCIWPILDAENLKAVTNGAFSGHWDYPGGILLPMCLLFLIVLHMIWFYLILRLGVIMIVSSVTGAEYEDVRSEEHEEDGAKRMKDFPEAVKMTKLHNM